MLDILVNGERLSRAQFNDSLAKQHYSFGSCRRFRQPRKSYDTEFVYEVAYDLASPALARQQLVASKGAKKHGFNATAQKIGKIFVPNSPPPDTYNPRLLPKSRSCSFGVGRDVS
jgi:hypothetical protein